MNTIRAGLLMLACLTAPAAMAAPAWAELTAEQQASLESMRGAVGSDR